MDNNFHQANQGPTTPRGFVRVSCLVQPLSYRFHRLDQFKDKRGQLLRYPHEVSLSQLDVEDADSQPDIWYLVLTR